VAWCGRQNCNVFSFLWSFGRQFRNKRIIRFLKTLKRAQIRNCTCQIDNLVRTNSLKGSLHLPHRNVFFVNFRLYSTPSNINCTKTLWRKGNLGVEVVENACNLGLLHKLIFQQNEVHSQTIPWSKKVKSTAEVPNKWCHNNERWVEHSSSSNQYSSEASLPQRWKLPSFLEGRDMKPTLEERRMAIDGLRPRKAPSVQWDTCWNTHISRVSE